MNVMNKNIIKLGINFFIGFSASIVANICTSNKSFSVVFGIIVFLIILIFYFILKKTKSTKNVDWDNFKNDLLINDFEEYGSCIGNDNQVYLYYSFLPIYNNLNLILIYYLSFVQKISIKYDLPVIFLLSTAHYNAMYNNCFGNKEAANLKKMVKRKIPSSIIYCDDSLDCVDSDFIKILWNALHCTKKDVYKNYSFILENNIFHQIVVEKNKRKGAYCILGGIDQKEIWNNIKHQLQENSIVTSYFYMKLVKLNGEKISISDYTNIPMITDKEEDMLAKLNKWEYKLNDNENMWRLVVKFLLLTNQPSKLVIRNRYCSSIQEIVELTQNSIISEEEIKTILVSKLCNFMHDFLKNKDINL